MLTCKQVAKSLADGDYAELALPKRVLLKLHVLLCFVCGRYHRHVMRFQNGIRRYRNDEPSRTAPPKVEFCLLNEERESIRRALDSGSSRLDVDPDAEP